MTQIRNKTEHKNTQSIQHDSTFQRFFIILVGIIQASLGFRFVLKLLGANPVNTLITYLYSFTDVLIAPFETMFTPMIGSGLETQSIFEPGTLLAMIIYGLISLGLFKLFNQEFHSQKNITRKIDQDSINYSKEDHI